MARKTTSEFIDESREVHGDRYDYSKAACRGVDTKTTIICSDHGPFEQTPYKHIKRRQGCPNCGGTKHDTTDSFITKAQKKHGDRYDYSRVDYVKQDIPVVIGCPTHGFLKQRPNNHLNRGCPKCGKAKQGGPKATRVINAGKRFIAKAQKTHGDLYDYSKSIYTGSDRHLEIICPVHGSFKQTPDNHYQSGCPACGIEKSHDAKRKSTEEFTELARKIHGDVYDYSQTEYIGNAHNVTIICRDHGPFQQKAANHAPIGHGCQKCANLHRRTQEDFEADARAVHGDVYDYSQALFKSVHKKVTIICPEHGPFDQVPSSHICAGTGCPDCAKTGFDPSATAYLYIIVLESRIERFVKIGITNNHKRRLAKLRADGYDLTIGCIKEFTLGGDAREQEKLLHELFAPHAYTPKTDFGGKTECFHESIINDAMGLLE